MFEKLKHRYITCLVLILLLFSLITVQMYVLVGKGEQKNTAGNQASVSVPGKRGSIYDTNGVALAYDKESYAVTFYRDPANNASSDRANYTQILMRTIGILEENGDKVIDTFLIVRDEQGNFDYNISKELSEETRKERIESWCANMQIADADMEAEDAADKITVWDNGGTSPDGKSTTANFVSGLMKAVPPMNELFDMAGMQLPKYLGEAKDANAEAPAEALTDAQ